MIDDVIQKLAAYASQKEVGSDEAYKTAALCLADSIGTALLALKFPECVKMLGPEVPGMVVPFGTRVPGTGYVLSPTSAAFNIGTMIRWLDYNDTFLAKEWGHPSDNLGALLGIGDFLSQRAIADRRESLTVFDLLTSMIQAYEIQGGLALSNSLNRVGFDHVMFVKIASAALSAKLLGGTEEAIAWTLSQAFIDTGPLRAYRHAPGAGPRKSWAAGDASARGLQLALLTSRGERGYDQPLTAPKWGFNEVVTPIVLEHPLGSYVMENILFKVSYPAEFHAQTAVECAVALHEQVKRRFHEIATIKIDTHESALRIIDKKGPLHNPADRDHCLQYMTAVALLKGNLTAEDYETAAASDLRIDDLRNKMVLTENKEFTVDYLDPEKRSIANGMEIIFKDGSSTGRLAIEYPIGHKRRRAEALPLLFQKFESNLLTRFSKEKTDGIVSLFYDLDRLQSLTIKELMRLVSGV